jgi:nucleoside-diphosphate-sugar epimerase
MPKFSFTYICHSMNKKIKNIGVFGCGWMGLPLAIELVANGYHLKGSTTTFSKLANLATNHIDPFLVQLNPLLIGDGLENFFNVDLLIINIPPKRHQGLANDYSEKMHNIALAIKNSPIKNVIFISSTSVYPENQTLVSEETPINFNSPTAINLFEAENIFRNLENIKTCVIRMAGLIGPNRHPGRFFSGKENIPNGLASVNLIHLDDCISIIKWVIEKEIWGETINAAAPSHPTKAAFYDLAAQKYNQTSAKFINEAKEFKTVSSEKLIKTYNYQFKVPNLMAWLLQIPQN